VSGKHASRPAEIADEQPLLLNPLRDDPAQHLEFDPESGRIIGTTERGRMTILVLNLNREGLKEKRRDIYESVRLRSQEAIGAGDRGDFKTVDRHLEFLLQHKSGQAEYAMAGRPAVGRSKETIRYMLQRLG